MHQNLGVYSYLYSEDLYCRVCSYIIHTDLYNILFLKNRQKCIFFKGCEFFLHFSSTYMHQNLGVYSYLYSEDIYHGVCSYFIRLVLFYNLSICAGVFHVFSKLVFLLQQHLHALKRIISIYILKVSTEGVVYM